MSPPAPGSRYPELAATAVLVTGGASGIGASTALEFARCGARVAVLDIDGGAAEATAQGIVEATAATGAEILPIAADVSDGDAVRAGVAAVVAAFGPLRAVVNSAVSFTAAGLTASTAQWDRSLGVNVRGTAQVTAACAEHFAANAAVVNLASVSAHVAQPERWTYNATKAAIVALTRCQALDLAPAGIRVNCVSPGWIWTPEVARAAGGDRAASEPAWGRFHMLRRLGEAVEVARAILFLCSADASFITGTELMVDGGYSALSAEGLGERSAFAGSD